MLAALRGIEAAAHGRSYDDYRLDWMLKHAIQRGIEIISEASRLLPEEVHSWRPDVPWTNIRNIGNVLHHGYHSLSDSVIWGLWSTNCLAFATP